MTLDKNGFKKKTYDELLKDMSQKAKQEFGADANITDGALAILIRIMAWFISLAWAAIEMVYHSSFIRTATGNYLDALIVYLGISRNLATYANGYVTFTGRAGYEIDIGVRVETEAGTAFETYESGIIGENGTTTLGVYAVEAGVAGNVAIGMINTVTNPVAEITSVINAEAIEGGAAKETDDALRRRARRSVEGMGDKTRQALDSELLDVKGVLFVTILENTGVETDVNDTPAHAFQPFVYGGSDYDIAAAILRKKSHGIRSYGTTVVSVPDIGGTLHEIGFTRAIPVQVHVRGKLKRNDAFPANGLQLVRDAMINYVGGVMSDGSIAAGVGMGKTVYFHRLMGFAALACDGISDVECEVSRTGTAFHYNNIPIAYNEVPVIQIGWIEVIDDVLDP